jgi:hypothetical protein
MDFLKNEDSIQEYDSKKPEIKGSYSQSVLNKKPSILFKSSLLDSNRKAPATKNLESVTEEILKNS